MAFKHEKTVCYTYKIGKSGRVFVISSIIGYKIRNSMRVLPLKMLLSARFFISSARKAQIACCFHKFFEFLRANYCFSDLLGIIF